MPGKTRQNKSQRESQGKRPPAVAALRKAPTSQRFRKPWQIAAVCVILAVVTVLVYSGVRNNDFLTYDDGVYVSENHQVQMGVNPHTIAWAFPTFHA